MTNTFKHKLLLGTALVAVAGFAGSAQAVELAAGANAAITADDLAGIIESGGQTGTVVLDSDGKTALNLGTNAGVPAVTTNGTTTITITETTPLAGDIVSFDGDVVEQTGGVLKIINQNDTLATFNGNITSADNLVELVLGDGAGSTAGFVFNSDGNEALSIDASILAAAAGDTTSVTVLNGGGEANNAITFVNGIGGTAGTAATAIDSLTIGDDTTAGVDVVFQDDVNVSGNIAVSTGNVNNATYNLTFGTTSKATAVSGNFTMGGAGDTVNLKTLDASTVTFNGTITVDNFSVGAGSTATAKGDITAATTLGSAASKLVLGDTAGSIADLDVTGDITGAGTLVFAGVTASGDGHDVAGSVGASTTGNKLAKVELQNVAAGGNDAHNITTNLYTSNLQFGTTGVATTGTADATLNLTGNTAAIVVDSVTTTVNNEGTLNIAPAGGAGSTATIGSIGASGKAVKAVTVDAQAANATVNVTGNVYATNISINDNAGAGTLVFKGTSAQTVDALIDSAAQDNEGSITVGATGVKSNVTFNKALGTTAFNLKDLNVLSGSTATLAGLTNDFDGALTIDGTVHLNQGVSLDVGSVATGTAKGVLELTIGTTTAGVDQSSTLTNSAAAIDWGQLDGTVANGATILLKQGTGVILNGKEFVIADGTGAVTTTGTGTLVSGGTTGATVADDYALFSFTAYRGDDAAHLTTVTDSSQVVAKAAYVDSDSVTKTTNNARTADGLVSTTVAQYNAADQKFKDVYDTVTRKSVGDVDKALEAVQPAVDGGNVVAATTVSSITSNLIQLASTDAQGSGIAAGNISNGLRAWGQVFGQTGTQDTRDNIDGYDIDTYGFAVGLDTQALAEQMVVGLAFSYANSEVDSENANNAQTDIDTYQVTLYGTYNVDEATYISGQLGYAFGSNDTDRSDLGGVNGVDAHGSYDSNQFIARLEAGRAYEVGKITTLTPKVSADYNYYDADSYRETGAGGAGLNVNQDSLSSFKLGAGVDADWLFQQADGSYLKPQVRVGASYDLVGDEVQTTSSFIGGGSAFQTKGFDSQDFAVTVGTGVTYFTTSNWEFTANYDYEWKQDYDSHAGFLRAGYKF